MAREQDVLTITKNGQPIKTMPLAAEITFGRHQSATVQLEDPQMSRVHLRILKQGERYVVVDQSLNGTLHNGRRMTKDVPEELTSESVVRCACFELRFTIANPNFTETIVNPPSTHIPVPKPVQEAPPPPNQLPSAQAPFWTSGEATLQVAGIIEETSDAKTFRFVSSDAKKPLLFAFKPGQFLTISVGIDGKDVKRSYTISSSPSRPHVIEITVKRVPGGVVSNFLNDNLKLGDQVRVRGPAGKFSCFNYPSRKILGIAGGSGITPIMSMARWIVDTAADIDFTMVYSARTPKDLIFRRELEYLATRHPGFRVLVTVSGGGSGLEPWLSLTGRVDERMLRLAAPDLDERHVFMCGPPPFMDTVKDVLKSMGFPLEHLHTESFGAGRVAAGTPVAPKPPPPPAPVAAEPVRRASPMPSHSPAAPAPRPREAAPSGFQVQFRNSGKTVVTDGSIALLDLAEQNGIEISYGCRSGSCGACRTRCDKSGKVDMGSDYNLDPDDAREGFVLACCAKPRSNLVVEA